MRRESKTRRITGFMIYANVGDGRGHVPVGNKKFKTRETAASECNRLLRGKSAGLYSKPVAIPVLA